MGEWSKRIDDFRSAWQYHSAFAHAKKALPDNLFIYHHLAAALLVRLGSGSLRAQKSIARAFQQAGIRSVLEIGGGVDSRFLRYLDRTVPPDVELFGLSLHGAAVKDGRLDIRIGEAAELEEILEHRRFDLVISNGVFSRGPLESKRYDPDTNARRIMEGSMHSLSDHPKAAVIFRAYSQDSLFYKISEFEEFGEVAFSVPKYPEGGQYLLTVVVTARRPAPF